jgi:predicted RecB family endonuclease
MILIKRAWAPGDSPWHRPGASWDFHKATMKKLRDAGWKVRCEYPQDYVRESTGRLVHGWIDIWAEKDGKTLAVECDANSPRKNSIQKLTACPASRCIVLCRNGHKLIVR